LGQETEEIIMDKSSLGDRQKGYENASKSSLLRRTPVVIRIDGKAFHTWTKRLAKYDDTLKDGPFSELMHECMTHTTEYLVSNIQNAVLGYTQSDEISILLNDWKTLTTDQWFGGGVQKITSVAASMATAHFNLMFSHLAQRDTVSHDPALFDARVFNVPKEDVTNYFLWRQQDATRNSVQMLGRFYFSHKEMHKKNVSNIQDMLMLEHDVNWNDIDTWKKRGSAVWRIKDPRGLSQIIIDEEIPIFTQDRNYIERLLLADEKLPTYDEQMSALKKITNY